MVELDAFTGLRRGEPIGLRWEDADFERLVLHVRSSVVAMVEGVPMYKVVGVVKGHFSFLRAGSGVKGAPRSGAFIETLDAAYGSP